ncbi:hypothetical protein ABTX77_39065 [Streptomyces sp. NPDC097704]|uniref:hypothetical protein n=1 Tax=Streptomyces sp. NPDC097704 TaxID=3157101 RepID=UPI00332E759D
MRGTENGLDVPRQEDIAAYGQLIKRLGCGHRLYDHVVRRSATGRGLGASVDARGGVALEDR